MTRLPVRMILAAVLLSGIAPALPGLAQSSDFTLNVHANSHATAEGIGLPVYPGATPFKDKDSDSSSADLGFLLNSFQMSLKVASFVSTDSPQHILDFYRKPLAKFGEVLECDHGKPVGSLTITRSGLTCGDRKGGHMTVNGSDSDHELRAGTPERYRMVGVEKPENGKIKFGLVSLILPKESNEK